MPPSRAGRRNQLDVGGACRRPRALNVVQHDIGGRLYPLFVRAGLPGPGMRQDVSVGGGPDMRDLCRSTAETVRSLLPRIERLGVARADEVDVDTLAERLERAMNAADSQIRSVPIMAAWATRP